MACTTASFGRLLNEAFNFGKSTAKLSGNLAGRAVIIVIFNAADYLMISSAPTSTRHGFVAGRRVVIATIFGEV